MSNPLQQVAPRARIGCELLEARDNPAGNVSAFVSGNDLFVIGDGNVAGNQVQVTQDGFGNVFVNGLSGTTVNGQAGVYVGTGVPNRVSVQLGGTGPDLAVLSTLTANSIDIITGEGNDQVALNGVMTGSLGIDTGGADDSVDLRNVFAMYGAYVSGGGGFDTLYYGGVSGPADFQQFEQVFPV